MRILVCGSRHLKRQHVRWMHDRLAIYEGPVTLIEGGAKGADRIARRLARWVFKWEVKTYEADWEIYHRRAGPIRNGKMLRMGKPLLVVAFHVDPSLGNGTLDMVTKARMAGVATQVHIFGPLVCRKLTNHVGQP